MFTGIVQGSFAIRHIERKQGLYTLDFEFSDRMLEGLEIGASVAVDGVCLTVSKIFGQLVNFDVMQETLAVTTLGDVQSGMLVNIERSAKQGVEIGGHIISGHVDGCARVVKVEQPENNCFVTYEAPAEKIKYIFSKGFVGLNGCSLTVADVDKEKNTFRVCYIPETLRVTTHGQKKMGDKLNFEIDRQTQTIVDTVENFLSTNPALFT
ncbi:MAG: riboflavin synthase [Oceanicoccus sp.]|jgi:riboflavin synthase